MAYTKANMRAVDKYVKANFDSILLRVPKGRKRLIQAFAKKQGKSVNGFITEQIYAAMGLTDDEGAEYDDGSKCAEVLSDSALAESDTESNERT